MKLDKISSIIAPLSAVISVLALASTVYFSSEQIKTSHIVQEQASARDAFKDYLKVSMDREAAMLAGPQAAVNPPNNRGESYAWFVSYFLFTAEQVFYAFPEVEAWRQTLSDQFCYYGDFLLSDEFQKGGKDHYSPEFSGFLDKSLVSCGSDVSPDMPVGSEPN